jgi:hypothetical protein
MAGSYDRRLSRVRWLLAGCVAALGSTGLGPAALAQTDASTVRLQLRVFDGSEEVAKETRLTLYPRGQRTGDIPLTLSPDQAYEATVTPGFYDVQVIRERRGQVVGIRWVEQVLVQRYPDEYGRNLHVINLNAAYGALQIRPAPAEVAAAKGWSAVVHPAGDAAREVAKARPAGEDLLVVVPAGRYDVRVNLPNRTTTWLRDVDIPVDRTRLKTWSATAPTP